MKIELKNLKHYEAMSDETNSFSAKLCVDGKIAALCKDDGRGGCIDFLSVDHELLKKTEDYCKTLPQTIYAEGTPQEFKLDMTLDLFVGDLVEKSLREKELAKFRKRMEKDCINAICYGNETSYRSVYWKNYTITQMLGTPVGNAMIQKKVDELKERGETILNTNLTGIIL